MREDSVYDQFEKKGQIGGLIDSPSMRDRWGQQDNDKEMIRSLNDLFTDSVNTLDYPRIHDTGTAVYAESNDSWLLYWPLYSSELVTRITMVVHYTWFL